jgi:hypothetical protein
MWDGRCKFPPQDASQKPSYPPHKKLDTRMSHSTDSTQLSLRRLWWLDPVWPFAAVVGVTIVVACLQSDAAFELYGTPKYVLPWHVLLAAGAILAFLVGRRLAETTGRTPEPTSASCNHIVRGWFHLTAALTVFGYTVWLAVGIKNGFSAALITELLFTDNPTLADHIRTELFPTLPGVTTCTQFGVPSMLLGLWLYFRGERQVLWGLGVLAVLALLRAIVFSERTAVLELVVPGVLVGLRLCVLGRPLPGWCRAGLQIAPLAGPLALVLFFGSFEYFRSWRYYKEDFDSYAEFTVWRLSGYYTTAHNNGAMALETHQPRPLPYYTLRPLWLFPGVRNSPFGYEQLTGFDPEENHTRMLERYGNIELNNEGGLFQPAIDFGLAGSLLFWCGYGFMAGRFYRGFQAGTLAGVTIYPLIYLSILEVPLVLFLCYPRLFPGLVTLVVVAWMTRTAAAPEEHPAMSAILEEVR